jgi:hypothetical protein
MKSLVGVFSASVNLVIQSVRQGVPIFPVPLFQAQQPRVDGHIAVVAEVVKRAIHSYVIAVHVNTYTAIIIYSILIKHNLHTLQVLFDMSLCCQIAKPGQMTVVLCHSIRNR